MKRRPSRALNAARNPVSRAIEKALLLKWQAAHVARMKSLSDGEDCAQLLVNLAEVLATAIKSIEGWDDPEDIGGHMVEAMDALKDMSNAGQRWNSAHIGLLVSAVDAAVQITTGNDIVNVATALHWARSVLEAA